MKRLLLIYIFIVTPITFFSQSNDYRKWSLAFEKGLNLFDGDVHQSYNDIIPNSVLKRSFGLSTECTLTPFWGFGAELYYLPFAANDATKNFDNTMYQFNPYIAINLLNLCNENNHSKWGIYSTVGIGLAYYNATLYKNNIKFDKVKNGLAITIPVGALIEYNVSQSLAIGAKFQYRQHNKDNLEGTNLGPTEGGYNIRGTSNDNMILSTVSLRWKIGAESKSHVRNNNTRTTLGDLLKKVNETNEQLSELKSELENIKSDSCKEYQYEKEENKETLFFTVYFDFDSYTLTPEARETIKRIAKKLQEDPTLKVEIYGYTDYVGNIEYNKHLSQQRAERVKNELVNVYGIHPKRIIAKGKGKITIPNKAERTNRKCEIFLKNN